jgi:hypothetical protein
MWGRNWTYCQLWGEEKNIGKHNCKTEEFLSKLQPGYKTIYM